MSGPWRDLDSFYNEGCTVMNQSDEDYSFHEESSDKNQIAKEPVQEVKVTLIPRLKVGDSGDVDQELEDGELSDVEAIVEIIPKGLL